MDPVQPRYEEGTEMANYQGMEIHPYGGMDVNHYQGEPSDEGSEKDAIHSRINVYDEDPHSRLRRDLKARQITMIALGGALGTGLLINT